MPKKEKDAYRELVARLHPNETVAAIVFGPWGWGTTPSKNHPEWELGFEEPTEDGKTPLLIPFEVRGKVLGRTQARHYMKGWSFYGGIGQPKCYATWIWTNQRVIWITQYNNQTSLSSMPITPIVCLRNSESMPYIPGG